MSDSLVLAALTRLEAGQAQLQAELCQLKAEQKSLRSDFLAELGRTRGDIMERVERLEDAVNKIRARLCGEHGRGGRRGTGQRKHPC